MTTTVFINTRANQLMTDIEIGLWFNFYHCQQTMYSFSIQRITEEYSEDKNWARKHVKKKEKKKEEPI